MPRMRDAATNGETVVAILLSLCAGLLAAVFGFMTAVVACNLVLSGEMGEWGLIAGPAAGLILGTATFAICFRWFRHYGDSSKSGESD